MDAREERPDDDGAAGDCGVESFDPEGEFAFVLAEGEEEDADDAVDDEYRRGNGKSCVNAGTSLCFTLSKTITPARCQYRAAKARTSE